MAVLTIRNLDEKIKRKLQVRAALNGRSMEAEARELLSASVSNVPENALKEEGLGTAIHRLFAPLGGADLPIQPRQKSQRPTPIFDE